MRGHLRKRGKNSWTIVLSLGKDPATGKRQQQWVTLKGTRRDAERKLAGLLYQADAGGYVKPTKLTLGEYLRQWLRDYAASRVRPRTLEGYQEKVGRP